MAAPNLVDDLAAARLHPPRPPPRRGAARAPAPPCRSAPSARSRSSRTLAGRSPTTPSRSTPTSFPRARRSARSRRSPRSRRTATATSIRRPTAWSRRPPSSRASSRRTSRSYPGSSLALHHAVIAFTSPERALIVAEPGYEAAAHAAEFIGAKVVRVPLRADGAHDLPAMLAAAKTQPTGLFYVCNPNNPTGTVTPRAEIEALIAAKPAGSIVLIDEAYIHFCDEPPGASTWCAPGRTSSCCAPSRRSTAWPACAPASRSRARTSLERVTATTPAPCRSPRWRPRTRCCASPSSSPARKRRQRRAPRRPHALLRRSTASRTPPSVSNKLMVDARMPTQQVIDGLKQRNVYVGRPWPVWPTHVRVSIGSAEDMARFKAAFLEVTANGRARG